MTALVVQGDARRLPLPDASVDLIVTSPPYFALRSYTDGCPTCADTARAGNRGYMERYCPNCDRVFTSGRNKCHKCDVTTLVTEKTKETRRTDCLDCGGTGRGHYPGQIGSEQTPAEYLDALWACTAEWMRVLKPEGSMFVNLGDKYSTGNSGQSGLEKLGERWAGGGHTDAKAKKRQLPIPGMQPKSLLGIPWRYAIGCIDTTRTGFLHVAAIRRVIDELAAGEISREDAHRRIDQLEAEAAQGSPGLGLILRAEIIWSKPNGLPESVTDRVRRSHEQWFHFVKQPRYYSAVDEVRETHAPGTAARYANGYNVPKRAIDELGLSNRGVFDGTPKTANPLGKLPGSVWTVPSEPLQVPDHLGVDHFAAFPTEWPRRLILGWSPPGICTACGQGRRPVADVDYELLQVTNNPYKWRGNEAAHTAGGQGRGRVIGSNGGRSSRQITITGYACACTPESDPVFAESWASLDDWVPPPTRPAVILDPFGGTGTTALVAHALGRVGISVDMSGDYSRLAKWRCTDRGELAKAMRVEKPPPVPDGQMEMFA